jgi:RNA polymerase sigma factor (sigma-70 family)
VDRLTELVRRAQAGDERAFDAIVRRLQDMAVAYAYAVLGDFHLAQDAAQEAFLDAFRELPRLREPAAFLAWFRRVVYKQCDRQIRRRRLTIVPLDQAAAAVAHQGDPAAAAERRAEREIVRSAIQALPERERVVAALFYIGGHSQREISAFLGVPISTVKNRLHASRGRLKERMLALVQHDLHSQRPSQDERFAARVSEMLQAARVGDGERVRALLDADGALVGPVDDPAHGHDRVTPLHYAAEHGQIEVARALLERGADINAVEPSHQLTPLGWATTFPRRLQREMAEFLLSRGARLDIHSAAALGMTHDVEVLLRQDPSLADQRLTDNNGALAPLHLAAWWGHTETVRLLLAHGADPTAQDWQGKTPLERARQHGHAETAAVLREHRGRATRKKRRGNAP